MEGIWRYICNLSAVFLVSMCITGMQFGNEVAMHVSRGAVFGMIGVLCSILATWGLLQATHMWLLSIIGGFVAWFVSALIILKLWNSSHIKEGINMAGRPKDPTINKKFILRFNVYWKRLILEILL